MCGTRLKQAQVQLINPFSSVEERQQRLRAALALLKARFGSDVVQRGVVRNEAVSGEAPPHNGQFRVMIGPLRALISTNG